MEGLLFIMKRSEYITRLYLLRHGETVGAEIRRYKGTIDVPLSETGRMQMKNTAHCLFTHLRTKSASVGSISALYTSDLSRARDSAEIIASQCALSPVVHPALRERHFGVWEGMSFEDIREKYPAEFDAWAGNPLKFSPLDGETTAEVKTRVITAVDDIMSKHRNENIIIVAHGGVNRVVLCHYLGMSLEHIFRIEQDYAAMNIIEFQHSRPFVKMINGCTTTIRMQA